MKPFYTATLAVSFLFLTQGCFRPIQLPPASDHLHEPPAVTAEKRAVSPEHNTTTKKVKRSVPKKPKKDKKHQLQKVEDDNFSPEYMYPGEKKKPTPSVPKVVSEPKPKSDAPSVSPVSTAKADTTPLAVSKEECLSLIGEAKFARYTEMLGSEAAALKRCAMLKAMR